MASSWPLRWRVGLAVLGFVTGVVWLGDGVGWWDNLAVSRTPVAVAVTTTTTLPSAPDMSRTSAKSPAVVVIVSGPALKGAVAIYSGDTIEYRSPDVALPFTWTSQTYDAASGIFVTAKGLDFPSIWCTLSINGKVVSRQSTTDASVLCDT